MIRFVAELAEVVSIRVQYRGNLLQPPARKFSCQVDAEIPFYCAPSYYPRTSFFPSPLISLHCCSRDKCSAYRFFNSFTKAYHLRRFVL